MNCKLSDVRPTSKGEAKWNISLIDNTACYKLTGLTQNAADGEDRFYTMVGMIGKVTLDS